jgi:hypothetical protein
MKRALVLTWLALLPLVVFGQNPLQTLERYFVASDGSDWHLKGEGIVCCPCTAPCPCRTNDKASYGHCEATLYLRVRQGHYGPVSLNNLSLVNTSGNCAMSYDHLAALYFDRATSREQRQAFLKLMASFTPAQSAEFPSGRVVDIKAEVTGGHLYNVSIPGILQMIVDRNWGRSEPPMPMYAASDYFSNTLQYVKNLRYVMHDTEANLDFDYSRRQANYREVDLDVQQYRSKRMLIQFLDGRGWFNEYQMRLIRELGLTLPDLEANRKFIASLR